MGNDKFGAKRQLTGAFFQSLDGVIQSPGAPEEDSTGGFRLGGWSATFWDESTQAPSAKIYDREFDLLLGRRTYEIFNAYWPYNQDNPIGAKFQRINKYVLTHSDRPLTWEGSHKLSGDIATVVGDLKNSDGRNLLIQGSSTLYPPLLAAGLIDRLIVITLPVLIGPGKRIFSGSEKPGALKLVGHFVADSGIVFATYEQAGEVPIGSFEFKTPSELEMQRRQQWASEER